MSCLHYIDRCEIQRRVATTTYGGTGADTYTSLATNVPCLFIERPGRALVQDTSGRDIISDGILRVEKETIKTTDLIIISGFKYEAILVQPMRDRIKQSIEYYRVFLQRRGTENADEITIS